MIAAALGAGRWSSSSLTGRLAILSLCQPAPSTAAGVFKLSKGSTMARPQKLDDLSAIEARREALRAELADLDEKAKAAEQAARDAGRPTLLAALERVKISELSRQEARTIANAIGQHGAKAVADYLNGFEAN
jgi:hypothetical protein